MRFRKKSTLCETTSEPLKREPHVERCLLQGPASCSEGPFFGVWTHFSLDGSCGYRGQVSDPHQIVSGRCQREAPTDALHAAEASSALQRHGLEPTKDLLYPLAFDLARGIAGMPRRPPINGAAARASGVLRHMRSSTGRPHRGHKLPRVVGLVGAHG